MKNPVSLILLITAILFTGCQSLPPRRPADNPEHTDPSAATYRGTLPCADCNGIDTSLQLKSDNRYTLTMHFNDSRHKTENISGIYRKAEDKPFIQLDNAGSNLTFFTAGRYLELRLPDGSIGNRRFADEKYRLQRE